MNFPLLSRLYIIGNQSLLRIIRDELIVKLIGKNWNELGKKRIYYWSLTHTGKSFFFSFLTLFKKIGHSMGVWEVRKTELLEN